MVTTSIFAIVTHIGKFPRALRGAESGALDEGTGFFAPRPELNGSGTPFQIAVDSAGDWSSATRRKSKLIVHVCAAADLDTASAAVFDFWRSQLFSTPPESGRFTGKRLLW